VVLAYRQQGSQLELVVMPGIADQDGTVSAPLQAGMRGAPAFDRSGALRGLVRDGPDERRVVAGVIPPARYTLETGGLSGLVQPAEPAAAQASARPIAEIAASVRDSVVPIACGS
jgi:hypothetical protein